MKTMLYALLLFCAATATVQAAPSTAAITAQVQPREITIGEPLALAIQMKGPTPSLSGLDLKPLKSDFYIQSLSSGGGTVQRNGRTEQSQQMTVTLYPLRSGQLMIPALDLAGHRTQPIAVRVRDAGPAGTRMQVSLSSTEPWVRQEIVLRLDIYREANLIWSPVRLDPMPGLYLGLPSETEQQITEGSDTVTLHRYSWSVVPVQAGNFTLTLPMLEATRFGTTLRYAIPPVTFSARPVPAYLPVGVPIGKPRVRQAPLPLRSVVDHPETRSFIVAGGMSEQYLRGLLARLAQTDSLKGYPASIASLPGTYEAPGPTLQVSLPFRALKPGTVRLPDIDLPYYDPQKGTIESIRLLGPSMEIGRRPGITPRQAAGSMLTLASLIGIGWWMRARMRSLRPRRSVLRRIREARTPNQIAAALIAYSIDDDSGCRTLSRWLLGLRLPGDAHNALRLLVDELEQASFGARKKPVELEDLRRRAMAALKGLPLNRKNRREPQGKGRPAEGTSDAGWIYAGIEGQTTISEAMK